MIMQTEFQTPHLLTMGHYWTIGIEGALCEPYASATKPPNERRLFMPFVEVFGNARIRTTQDCMSTLAKPVRATGTKIYTGHNTEFLCTIELDPVTRQQPVRITISKRGLLFDETQTYTSRLTRCIGNIDHIAVYKQEDVLRIAKIISQQILAYGLHATMFMKGATLRVIRIDSVLHGSDACPLDTLFVGECTAS